MAPGTGPRVSTISEKSDWRRPHLPDLRRPGEMPVFHALVPENGGPG